MRDTVVFVAVIFALAAFTFIKLNFELRTRKNLSCELVEN